MASFTESLTIAIRGDSSDLSRELDRVGQLIAGLENRLARLGRSQQDLGRAFEQIGRGIRPLQAISGLLDQIIVKVRILSQTPIVLNVQPAVNALLLLGALIDATAARLARLSAISAVSAGAGGFPGRVPGFAAGGLVSGPPGLDRVPALLTAGEFVLRRSSVEQLGASFLSALNQAPRSATQPSRAIQIGASGASPSVTNNLGGITVNVTQAAEVPGLLRDMEFQNSRLRARRG